MPGAVVYLSQGGSQKTKEANKDRFVDPKAIWTFSYSTKGDFFSLPGENLLFVKNFELEQKLTLNVHVQKWAMI